MFFVWAASRFECVQRCPKSYLDFNTTCSFLLPPQHSGRIIYTMLCSDEKNPIVDDGALAAVSDTGGFYDIAILLPGGNLRLQGDDAHVMVCGGGAGFMPEENLSSLSSGITIDHTAHPHLPRLWPDAPTRYHRHVSGRARQYHQDMLMCVCNKKNRTDTKESPRSTAPVFETW